MKIAMLTKHFNFRNGSSRVIHEISERLSVRGHEVHIFCNKRPDSYTGTAILRHLPMLPFGSWSRVLSFSIGCSLSVQRTLFDIVHGHGNSRHQDLATVHVCRQANLLARGRPLSRWDPHLWLERRQFEAPGLLRIITPSEMVKRDLHRHYQIPLDRMVVIPNGVDPDRFHPDVRLRYREEMRKKHGIHDGELIVLCVASGNFVNRGILNLYAALRRLEDPRLRVMIIGGDRLGRFQRAADELRSRLVFVPFTEMIERYYGAGDALVFPSYYDTFGQVVLEAMACGLPVVVSARAGASEIVTDGKDGLTLKDPEDAAALAERLRLLADPALRERLGRAARQTALRYGWDEATNKTFAEYEHLLRAEN
ncbi:MAG: glycosyltransferase family 4 protein [Nitrospirae bacterium]|nr:glycosyltransferase family 4 protein [Nitrospirota bacterium]